MRLMALEQRGGVMVVTGELLDRELRTGVPFRWVTVSVNAGGRAHRKRLRTDRWGRFRLPLPASARGTVTISGGFTGGSQYASTSLDPRPLDVSRQALNLELRMAKELAVTQATHPVTVRTSAGGRPAKVPIRLLDGRGRLLARITTDARGVATHNLATPLLGKPGPVTVQARFSGSPTLNPATRRFEALLVSPVTITLEAGDSRVDSDGEITLTGTISDHGGPVVGAPVGIHALGERVDTSITDEEGAFQLRMEASGFPAGSLDLQARYTPNVVWRRAARSPAVEITVLAPRPIPPHLYLLPLFFTALVVLGLVLVSQRARLARLLLTLRGRMPLEPVQQSGESREQADSGVRLARRSIRHIISPDNRISGEVWDATDSRLLPGARIRLLPVRGAEVELATGRDGRFRSPALAEGEYSVIVTNAGYVSERFSVSLPHRGSLRGIRVDLVQVRVRILELYRTAARPLLPRESLWACWTPRELLHHVARRSGRHPGRALDLLTRLLEMSYWGGVVPDEDTLHKAHILAADCDGLHRNRI